MKRLVWHNEKRKASDLIPWDRNPRKLTDTQARDLRASLERFNLVEPPAIDVDNKLVGGHQRLKILLLLGRGKELIDVRVPNRKLTAKEYREIAIRLNKNHGDWDFDILASFDKDMLLEAGFTDRELSIFKKEHIEGEIKISPELREMHNYLLFYFDDEVDWISAKQIFGVKSLDALKSKQGRVKKGVGRVIPGKELLKKIK